MTEGRKLTVEYVGANGGFVRQVLAAVERATVTITFADGESVTGVAWTWGRKQQLVRFEDGVATTADRTTVLVEFDPYGRAIEKIVVH